MLRFVSGRVPTMALAFALATGVTPVQPPFASAQTPSSDKAAHRMPADHLLLIALGVLIVAFLYSSVGHAGASGYIAVMSLLGMVLWTLLRSTYDSQYEVLGQNTANSYARQAVDDLADKLRGAILNGAESSLPGWLRRLGGI